MPRLEERNQPLAPRDLHAAHVAEAHDIVHADDHCVVAVKPAGLLAVPGRGPDRADCLWTRLRRRWPDALVVHRLDQATSGLMLFARGIEAQRRLSRAFEQRAVGKRYVAIVDGRVEDDAGSIDLPIGADWPNRPRQHVDFTHGRPAFTRWRVLARGAPGARDGAWTRLELEPVTGRAHQLRVHLLAQGHPILGDALYAPAAVQARAQRLLLHATALAFAHPVSGAPLAFTSPAPFQAAPWIFTPLKRLRPFISTPL
jgi:tRNA pseudouridine32 synthase/23S rRNA pseudouridine746 synthase